jgi:hypothetical protein
MGALQAGKQPDTSLIVLSDTQLPFWHMGLLPRGHDCNQLHNTDLAMARLGLKLKLTALKAVNCRLLISP